MIWWEIFNGNKKDIYRLVNKLLNFQPKTREEIVILKWTTSEYNKNYEDFHIRTVCFNIQRRPKMLTADTRQSVEEIPYWWNKIWHCLFSVSYN